MKKESHKRIDLYDIGDGLKLMNIIDKNEAGKMHHITTYIGTEGNGFVCVGNAYDLDGFGSTFKYQSFVQMQEACLPAFKNVYKTNNEKKNKYAL